MAVFICPKAFLGGGQNVVSLNKQVDPSTKVPSPEFSYCVCHGNRSVVVKLCDVSLFPEESSDALHPLRGGVFHFPKELEELKGQFMEVVRCPFDGFIG